MLAQNDTLTHSRRTGLRNRRFKKAQVVINSTGSGFDAIIRNMSRAGACIEIIPTQIIPRSFILKVSSESEFYHCRLAWRLGPLVGVEVLD